eukprot:maker-scaffold175_size286436-snap-gene-1.57 protein:Tk09297 transcript:maker-scaffold175_size286436-snap-gene-1.57-mRNA-1 annotation:"peptidyl-prolyl cis-trans isomerase a2"
MGGLRSVACRSMILSSDSGASHSNPRHGTPDLRQLARDTRRSLDGIESFLSTERLKFKRILEECEKLKAETLEKIVKQPLSDIKQCRDLLDVFTSSDVTEHKSAIEQMHKHIQGVEEEIQREKRILESVQDCAIRIGFDETRSSFGLRSRPSPIHHELNLRASEDNAPPGLCLIQSSLNEIFAQVVSFKRQHNLAASVVTAPTPMAPRRSLGSDSTSSRDDDAENDLETTATDYSPKLTWSGISKQILPLPHPERLFPESNLPHCFLDIRSHLFLDPVRVVIRLRPKKAPLMSENFMRLCTGVNADLSYANSQVVRAKNLEHLLLGDNEHQDGTGGGSAMGHKHFLADKCDLPDEKGAVRMRGMEKTEAGCMVGSQFFVWVADEMKYHEHKHTLVFGHVTEGLDFLQELSRTKNYRNNDGNWILKEAVRIAKCGML